LQREKITACVTAGNEEQNIARCLESVRWADELVVIDSFSTDRTVEISRRYTDRVYRHKWLGYIGQKNLACDMASHEWVLFIDADEEVSPELRDEILKQFDSGASRELCGYEFPRRVFFLGRWILHGDWYPDIKLRLFRRSRGRSGGTEPHDRLIVDGPVQRLRHCMYHYTYTDIADQVMTLNRFSSITAAGMHETGARPSLFRLLFRPPFRFFRSYFLKRGFLDGIPGLVIAACVSFSVFIKYAKLWELRHAGAAAPREDGSQPPAAGPAPDSPPAAAPPAA
jgi:glycosyltransferase involved in cell wall biosynthesis